jgi:hypothetical protein
MSIQFNVSASAGNPSPAPLSADQPHWPPTEAIDREVAEQYASRERQAFSANRVRAGSLNSLTPLSLIQRKAAIIQTSNGVQIRPLLDSEVQISRKYTAPGFKNGLKRCWEALTTRDTGLQSRVHRHVKKCGLFGSSVGFMAGAGMAATTAIPPELVASAVFGPAAIPAVLTARATMIIAGGVAGAFGGGLVGGAIGTTYSIVTLTKSDEYQCWKGKAIAQRVFPIWINFLGQQVREFICPITHELIKVPLRGPDGIIYEKEAIEARISNNITRESFVYADDYHKRLFDRLATIYNNGVVAALGPNIQSPDRQAFLGAIQAYAQDVLPHNQQIIANSYHQCLAELQAGRMTPNVYAQITREIRERMQIVPLPIFIA